MKEITVRLLLAAAVLMHMKTPERALSSKTMGSSLLKKDCCLSFC